MKSQPVLPLADLAEAIPFGHIVLTRLGLAVDTQRLQRAPRGPGGRSRRLSPSCSTG